MRSSRLRLPSHSYYDKDNRALASLIRARQPYLVKNALTGLAIVTFVGAVCTSQQRTTWTMT